MRAPTRGPVLLITLLTALGGCASDAEPGPGQLDTSDTADTAPTDTDTTDSVGIEVDTGDTEPPVSADSRDGDAGDTDDTSEAEEVDTAPPDPQTTQTIGPEGGTLALEGASLIIPAGALAADTALTLTRTATSAPQGFTAYSPVYRFEPSGLTFARAATLELAFEGDPVKARVFWSRRDAAGFERLDSTTADGILRASVHHFSEGFAGDGVDFEELADPSCTVTSFLEVRPSAPVSGAVSFAFRVDDCQGRPLANLSCEQHRTNCDIQIEENGAPLSVDADVVQLPADHLLPMVTLLLDMTPSSLTSRETMLEAAKNLIRELHEVRGLDALIGISVFSGTPTSSALVPHTLDTARLLAHLDTLATYTGDASSTNLFGSLVWASTSLSELATELRTRHRGGAWSAGHIVLFTDGRDTASLATEDEALAALSASSVELHVSALSSLDLDDEGRASLCRLAARGRPWPCDARVHFAEDATSLRGDFARIAARITAQKTHAHTLGYCSPKRTGQHTLTLGATSDTSHEASYALDATDFKAGCDRGDFVGACTPDHECGGLGCGYCDDRLAGCNAINRCDDFCTARTWPICGGRTFTNPEGYTQTCPNEADNFQCGNFCVDTTRTSAHCGSCDQGCAGPCSDSECATVLGLFAHGKSSCVTLSDGKALCWGRTSGIITAVSEYHTAPAPAPRAAGAEQIFIWAHGSVCIHRDGQVHCWRNEAAPSPVPNLDEVVQVDSDGSYSCARRADATVWCWSYNQPEPGQVSLPSSAIDVAAISLGLIACAVLDSGEVWCWSQGTEPVRVSGLDTAVEVDMSEYGFNCARTSGGEVWCWGYDSHGYLGDGTAGGSRSTPQRVLNVSGAVGISLGNEHACALTQLGELWCWGKYRGQYAHYSESTAIPRKVTFSSPVRSLSAGSAHTCVLLQDEKVECWGDNDLGQIGVGHQSTSSGGPVKW